MIFNRMREAITPQLWSKIYTHPFNIELEKGTLPLSVYHRFLEQDSLYLTDYSRALQIIGIRSNNKHHSHFFFEQSKYILEFERKLHEEYLVSKISPHSPHQQRLIKPFFQPAPTLPQKLPFVADYTQHLLTTAKIAPIEIAISSLLPCYYIYNALGLKMKKPSHINNPYHHWIATYSCPSFTASTKIMIQILNELGSNQGEIEQEWMTNAFLKSTLFELSLWNGIYTMQKPTEENNIKNDRTVYIVG